jgi:YHS domain-containing protein
MTFIIRVFRFLFWLLILSWGVSLVRRLVMWVLRGSNEPKKTVGSGFNSALPNRRLVRDPVCGTYVAEVLAIPLRQGSETLYFCSESCRDSYLSQSHPMAANG